MSNRKKQPLHTPTSKPKPVKPTAAPARGANIGVIVGAIVVIGIFVALFVLRTGSASLPTETVRYADQGVGLHLQSIDDALPTPYNSDPATSGWHVGSMLAPWGIQTQPIQDKVSVHNLEHGGIIIHYRPDIAAADLERITSLARDLQRQNQCLVVVPRDNLKYPIVVTAWTYMLPLDTVDTVKITNFFTDRVGQGPEPFCK